MIKLVAKKLIVFCLVVSFLVCSAVVVCCNASSVIKIGDLNLNGMINIEDINLLKRALSASVTLKGPALLAADMDNDGQVTPQDSNKLSRYLSGSYTPPVLEIPNPDPEPDEPVYTEPTLIISKVTAAKGERVEVTVDIANNPGIIGMQLELNYDNEALTLVSATNGSALSGLDFSKPGSFTSPCSFLWDALEVDEAKDGTAVTFKFEVSDSATLGEYAVEIVPSTVVGNDLNIVDIDIVNGSITVK